MLWINNQQEEWGWKMSNNSIKRIQPGNPTHPKQAMRIFAKNPAVRKALVRFSLFADSHKYLNLQVQRIDHAFFEQNEFSGLKFDEDKYAGHELRFSRHVFLLGNGNKEIISSCPYCEGETSLRDLVNYDGTAYAHPAKKVSAILIIFQIKAHANDHNLPDNYAVSDLTFKGGELDAILFLAPSEGIESILARDSYRIAARCNIGEDARMEMNYGYPYSNTMECHEIWEAEKMRRSSEA